MHTNEAARLNRHKATDIQCPPTMLIFLISQSVIPVPLDPVPVPRGILADRGLLQEPVHPLPPSGPGLTPSLTKDRSVSS